MGERANGLFGRHDDVAAVVEGLGVAAGSVVVYGEAGVGKTALVRVALAGQSVREGGCLATLSWSPYLPLRRAFGADLAEDVWEGDTEYVANEVMRALGDGILFVDDAQWADVETLQVLAKLSGAASLVATIRRSGPEAAAVLERLQSGGGERIDLEPLGGPEAEQLVLSIDGRLSADEVSALIARTGGNPLLIEELAASDRDAASLELALLARCRALPEEQLEGLALLALAARPLERSAVRAVDGLVESGLVQVRDDGEVGFRHALIQEVIGGLISDDRRQRCHLRLAELMPHPGERAAHLLAGGENDLAHAAAMEAVELAATPGERVAHLVTAARCVDAAAGAELRLQAAEAANTIDESLLAADLLDGVPDLPGLRFRRARQRATIAMFTCDYDALDDAILAQAEAAEPGSVEEALMLSSSSTAALLAGDLPRAQLLGEQAVAVADRIGAGRAAATKALADAYNRGGDERWREAMAAALELARDEHDFELEWRIANNSIVGFELWGPHAGGRALAIEMQVRCAELRLLAIQRNFEVREIYFDKLAADYPAVLARAPGLLAHGGAEDVVLDLAWALATAQFDTGRIEEAHATAEVMLSRGSQPGRMVYHLVRAWGFLEAGDHLRVLEEEVAFRNVESHPFFLTVAAPTFAWAALEADAPAPPDPPWAPTTGTLAGVTPEFAGIAGLRAGAAASAADLFAEAAAKYDDFQRRAAVRCRWARGEALRRAGDPHAEAELIEVEQEATGLGLVGVVNRCERSLRALGVRRSAATSRSGDSLLTARETELVGLVAGGLTDPAIAARLGISVRTVKTLLANARRKVGADNRRHLVALVAERGG